MKTTLYCLLAVAITATALGFCADLVGESSQRGAADNLCYWPEFHGPGRHNVSPDRGLMKRWPEGGPPLVWKFSDCGIGFAGVTIANGKIYTAGDFANKEMVLALDMNGNLLWKAQNGLAWRSPSPGARATPTYNEGKLYHLNGHGRLTCFDAETGRELWSVDIAQKFGGKHGIWGYAENVLVDEQKVYCTPGGPAGRIVALDKRTGEVVWTNCEIDDTAAYCSPRIVEWEGHRHFITMMQKTVVGVDADTGRLLWSVPFVPRSPQNALTPVFSDGYFFVACGHLSGGAVFKIDMENKTAKQVWFRRDLDNCHGGALLVNGLLYGTGCRQGGKNFYCVDFATGETVKLDNTLGKVAITLADGMIYALNHQGTVSLLEIGKFGFRVVSQFQLPKRPPNSYLAHPVVCGGRLYIRCGKDLYCFNVRQQND